MPPQSSDRPDPAERQSAYPAGKARQGDIVLRRPWQRRLFVGGLVLLILIVILAQFLA